MPPAVKDLVGVVIALAIRSYVLFLLLGPKAGIRDRAGDRDDPR